MLSLIISLIPFFLIAFYFLYLKSKGGMKSYANSMSNKKLGIICYECSYDLSQECSDKIFTQSGAPFLKPNHHIRICKSCERDRKVKSLINPLKSSYYKFDTIFFDTKFEKYLFIILMSAISLIFLQLILSIFKVASSSIPTNTLLTIYWVFMIYRVKIVMKGYKK
jgi:hypothetical protein